MAKKTKKLEISWHEETDDGRKHYIGSAISTYDLTTLKAGEVLYTDTVKKKQNVPDTKVFLTLTKVGWNGIKMHLTYITDEDKSEDFSLKFNSAKSFSYDVGLDRERMLTVRLSKIAE